MIMNVLSLILLIFLIYAIYGCHLFGNINKGDYIDDYINFKNFFYAMMTLFKISTVDNWFPIMNDIMNYKSFFFKMKN